MFLKFLALSTVMCLAVADVKHFSREYLPPALKGVQKKSDVAAGIVRDVEILPQQDEVDNNLKLDNLVALTKDARQQDPAYGFPGGFPGGFPNVNPGFPPQFLPGQVFPGQGFPPQGIPPPPQLFPPSPGFVNPGFPGQVYPGQIYPGQVYPGQVYPGQVYPGNRYPLPSPGFVNPGFPGPFYPNYPVYQSNEALKKEEAADENDDKKLRLRIVSSDTQYDADNGGYLYKKPSIAF